MPNMSPVKNPMPSQEPDVRNRNFEEVALGYTPELAADEAARCLNCKNAPCVTGCPVHVNIPGFIGKLKMGDCDGAYEILSASNALPAVCGRVCPQETQCEAKCVRGIRGESVGIGRLERFTADQHLKKADKTVHKPEPNGHKVAIVGAGPAGLTCAGDLAKLGYEVTVFEALHMAGGVLVYGIPQFRLPKEIVAAEIDNLKALGVRIETNAVVGRSMTVDELFGDGYEAVFLGTGAGLPMFMGIPGESLNGVCSANEFLTRVNLMKAYRDDTDTPVYHARRVVVVGGGNVAMDAARCAKRLGAEEVSIVYRRSEAEMPARREEIEHAKEEGILMRVLQNPVEILGTEGRDRRVCAIRCIRMELGEPDASGRRRPVEIPGSEYEMECDFVIMALGTRPNPLISSTTENLETKRGGVLVADEKGRTTREGVFAGGDAVTGAATVILAMGAGKTAASAIDEYIQSRK